MRLDRVRGCLLGMATSESAAQATEFMRLTAPPLPTLATGPYRPMQGGGPFRLPVGAGTDDLFQSIALWKSLTTQGRLDPDDLARRYLRFRQVTFDVGSTTSAALAEIARGTEPLKAGRIVWERSRRTAAPNGALAARSPVLGAFFGDRDEERRHATIMDGLLSHVDPRCLFCSLASAAIVGGYVSERINEPGDAVDVARAEIAACVPLVHQYLPGCEREIEQGRAHILRDVEMATHDDPELYGPTIHLQNQAGYVRVCFRLGLYLAIRPHTFEQSVVAILNMGSDSDTNAIFFGGLAGSRMGEDAIPAEWRRAVLEARLDEPPGPLRDEFSARQLLAGLDTIRT